MTEGRKKPTTKVVKVNLEADLARNVLLDSGFVEGAKTVTTDVGDETSDVYVMKEDDITYYAYALDRVADYCRRTDVTDIIATLRGAYPPTRVLMSLLGDDFKGNMRYVPTSNFVEDREELVKSTLEERIKTSAEEGKDGLHMFTVDLARSGTSSKRYIQMLRRFLPEILDAETLPDGFDVRYSLAKLWYKPGQVSNNPKRLKTSNPFKGNQNGHDYLIEQGVFFIPDWLAEDKPELLGIDYELFVPGKRGVKTAFTTMVECKKPIIVIPNTGENPVAFLPGEGQSTADVFVDIVLNRARNLSSYEIPYQKK
jgi:hypothetical protein